MTDRIGIWEIAGSDRKVEVATPVQELEDTETERRLEELLLHSPEVLLPGITLVGRQVMTTGGPLDLLGVDTQGQLVVFELKRGTLTRDAVAQVLDYASELSLRSPEDLARLIEQHAGRNGVEPIEDFLEWFETEFPNAPEAPPGKPRMVLLGLGADERAKRMVNYLAAQGFDIQLLTFQAFRASDRVFLARTVQSQPPVSREGVVQRGQKDSNLQTLTELAERQGVAKLLDETRAFVEQQMPSYCWPGKTNLGFYLADLTEEGRPTQRAYASLHVDQKNRGQIVFNLPERSIELATSAVETALKNHPGAKRGQSSMYAFSLPITASSWPQSKGLVADLLKAIAMGRQARSASAAQQR